MDSRRGVMTAFGPEMLMADTRVAVERNGPIWDTLMVRSEVPPMGWIKEVIQREDSGCLSGKSVGAASKDTLSLSHPPWCPTSEYF